MLVGLIVILAVLLTPVAGFVWRFRQNDEPVAGGSMGRQLFGRAKRDSWGPKSDPPPT